MAFSTVGPCVTWNCSHANNWDWHLAEVTGCGSSCLCGVHVLVDHLGSESNLSEVHDSVDGHSGCTDDLRGETDVQLCDFNITRNDGVHRTGIGCVLVVGDGTCS